MCCYSLELLLIPFLTIPAAILSVISMSSKNWLEAHVTDMPVAPPNDPQDRGAVPPGDIDGYLFGQLSPWYLCAAECTDCPQIRRTNMDCFWMRDWAATGFDDEKNPRPGRLTVVQHLEYWCLGSLILSLFPSLVVCLDRRGRLCPLDCRRPAIILLAIATVLSIATLAAFGVGTYDALDAFADGHKLEKTLAWPFYLRLFAAFLTGTAAFLSMLHEYKSRAGYQITETDEEKIIVIPVHDDDLIDEYPDYGDPL